MNATKITRLPIASIDDSLRTALDYFNDAHGGTVFHETAFNVIASEMFHTELSFFIAWANGSIIGLCPCHTFKKSLTRESYSNLSSFEIPYGGWIYDGSCTTLHSLLNSTRLRMNEKMVIYSSIEVSPNEPYKPPNHTYVEMKTVLLDLQDNSVEDLFTGFSHTQRNKIRKATKLGVEINEVEPGNFESFMELSSELKQHVGMPQRDSDYYNKVFRHYKKLGRACCMVAMLGDLELSSLILLANKSFCIIWIGGRNINIPKNLYQNELMIWEAICWAKKQGSKYFDLCVLDEEKHPNLARMKLSFSKDIKNYYYYGIKSFSYKIINRMQSLIGTGN